MRQNELPLIVSGLLGLLLLFVFVILLLSIMSPITNAVGNEASKTGEKHLGTIALTPVVVAKPVTIHCDEKNNAYIELPEYSGQLQKIYLMDKFRRFITCRK